MIRTQRYIVERLEPRRWRWIVDIPAPDGTRAVRCGLAGSALAARRAAAECADRIAAPLARGTNSG